MDYEDKAVYGGVQKDGAIEAEGCPIKDVVLTEDKDEKPCLELWFEMGSKLLNDKNKAGGWEPIPVHDQSTKLPLDQLLDDEELSKRSEIVFRQLANLLGLKGKLPRTPETLLKFAEGGEYSEALKGKRIFIKAAESNNSFYMNIHTFRERGTALSIEEIKAKIQAKKAGF